MDKVEKLEGDVCIIALADIMGFISEIITKRKGKQPIFQNEKIKQNKKWHWCGNFWFGRSSEK